MSTVAARRAATSAEGWGYTTLGRIAQVKGGKRLPKGERFADTLTSFPYIRVTDFANFSVNTSDLRYLKPETQATIQRYTISKNDVYISIAGSIGITGMIPPRLDGANLTENAAKLVLKENVIDSRFLMYYLASEVAQREIRGQTVKNAQPKLALARIGSLQIPVPPIDEQRKIAAILGLVQRAIEQQERLISLTTELKKALLHKLFTEGLRGESQKQTEIGLVPESWEVVPLGDVCSLGTGTTPSTARADYYNGDVPFVKTTDIMNNRIKKSQTHVSNQAVNDCGLKLYPPGTVLMAMYGQGKTRGQVAILEISAATSQNAAAIQPSKEINSDFLWQYLISRYQVLRSSGALGHISHLNLGYVRDFKIPKPSILVQREIAQILGTIDGRLTLIDSKRRLFNDLFRTLLHQLMTAQIRVHDLDLNGVLVDAGPDEAA
jgi:type I restriction enzyme S subunit